MKPQPGDPHVEVVKLPGCSWSLRAWLPSFVPNTCFIDFFKDDVAVNIPPEWTITAANSGFVLRSLETCFLPGTPVPPGTQKFMANQGCTYRVDFNDGQEGGVTFTTPQFFAIPAVTIAGVPVSAGSAHS